MENDDVEPFERYLGRIFHAGDEEKGGIWTFERLRCLRFLWIAQSLRLWVSPLRRGSSEGLPAAQPVLEILTYYPFLDVS